MPEPNSKYMLPMPPPTQTKIQRVQQVGREDCKEIVYILSKVWKLTRAKDREVEQLTGDLKKLLLAFITQADLKLAIKALTKTITKYIQVALAFLF